MNTPDISVIMSVYNGERYLAEAIDSILSQTFKNFELVVINDCSNDSTATILEDYASRDSRVKVYTNEVNLKLPSSLNKAIALCSGKYIARMDADDIALPDRLEKQFKFMEENSDTALSSCRFMTLKNGVYSSGGSGGRCDNDALRAMLLVTNPILHPGVIAKAEVMKALNYDTTLTCTEDLELWTRLSKENFKMQILPEYLLIYRLHDKQITSTTLDRQHKEVIKIQNSYYNKFLSEMNVEMQEFFISGVYFKEKADVNNLIKYIKWMKKENKIKKFFTKDALDYALFEILAEYKRCGQSKINVLKVMLSFSPLFIIKELLRRKKRAKYDIVLCNNRANELGLTMTSGTQAFPYFTKL